MQSRMSLKNKSIQRQIFPSHYYGSCHCEAIKFNVTDISDPIAHCHCSDCQKIYDTYIDALVRVNNLKFLEGFEQLKEYDTENGIIKTFCRRCGSAIGFRKNTESFLDIEIVLDTLNKEVQ